MFPPIQLKKGRLRRQGLDEAVEGGVAVVCKSTRESEHEWLWSAEKKSFFFENPQTRGVCALAVSIKEVPYRSHKKQHNHNTDFLLNW